VIVLEVAQPPAYVDKRESEMIVVEGDLQPHTRFHEKEISRRPCLWSSVLQFGAQTGSVRRIAGRSDKALEGPVCLVGRLRGVMMKPKRASRGVGPGEGAVWTITSLPLAEKAMSSAVRKAVETTTRWSTCHTDWPTSNGPMGKLSVPAS
jgi:hypothetical protein